MTQNNVSRYSFHMLTIFEKSIQKARQKNIADAERHRRTPRTLAVESKEAKKSVDIGATGEGKDQKTTPKP